MRRGTSLVEVLVSIGILAVLAGLLFPVFKGAKRTAQIAAAGENLRQLHVAASLYRTQHDGDGKFGKATEMGLVDGNRIAHVLDLRWDDVWRSPCGTHPVFLPEDPYTVGWMPNDTEGSDWDENIWMFRENALLVGDINCNDADVHPNNRFATRFAIGCLMSGTVVRIRAKGDESKLAFWSSPQP
jgi:type II secretory pathway pseudopilin PulG